MYCHQAAKSEACWEVMVHAFNPSSWVKRQADLFEFKVNQLYKSYFQNRLQIYNETLSQKKNKTKNKKKQMWSLSPQMILMNEGFTFSKPLMT